MRCLNCGWPNDTDEGVCVKCGKPLLKSVKVQAEMIKDVKFDLERRVYDFGSQCANGNAPHYYAIAYPCTLSILILEPKARFYIDVTKTVTPVAVENIKIKDAQLKNVNEFIDQLLLRDKHTIQYYICPFCGNIMQVIEWPRVTGDDIICECPYCRNRFAFEGTYFEPPKSIYDIAPNPYGMATHALRTNAERIASLYNGFVIYLEDRCLVVKFSINGCYVIAIISLYNPSPIELLSQES